MITNINSVGRYITVSKYREEHGDNVAIALAPEAEIILDWARDRMREEQRIAELAKTNASVADAAQAVKTAEEQLRMVVALVK